MADIIVNDPIGDHYLIELIDCDSNKLMYVDFVRSIFLSAARKSKATIINDVFHQFDPIGVSGLVLIAESHFSVHTWPEKSYAAAGIFTCGSAMQPTVAIEAIKRGFCASEARIRVLKRGA